MKKLIIDPETGRPLRNQFCSLLLAPRVASMIAASVAALHPEIPVFDNTPFGKAIGIDPLEERDTKLLLIGYGTPSPDEHLFTDWSYKPGGRRGLRPMATFTGVPPSATEACINAGIHKGHGWRGL